MSSRFLHKTSQAGKKHSGFSRCVRRARRRVEPLAWLVAAWLNPVVLAFGGCTVDGRRAPCMDDSPEVDVSADGDGYSDGLLTTVTVDREAHSAYRHNFNGTSAATPIVAGAAALLLSEYPDLARQKAYDILRVSADKIDQEAGEYDADGHSRFYGFGRINVRRALEEAAKRKG